MADGRVCKRVTEKKGGKLAARMPCVGRRAIGVRGGVRGCASLRVRLVQLTQLSPALTSPYEAALSQSTTSNKGRILPPSWRSTTILYDIAASLPPITPHSSVNGNTIVSQP